MSDWITPADVAAYLGTVEDDDARVISSTAAIRAAVEARRTELDFTSSETVPANVREGAKMWASLLVQQRSAPTGYDGYDADTALADAGAKRGEILRLLGWRRPVTG